MSLLAEGIWPCVVTSAAFGDNEGSPDVQINVKITEGPSAGRACTYQDQVNGKSAIYVGRSCKAVGLKGTDLSKLKEDCAAWIARTGGVSTVEIKHISLKRGQRFDRWVEGGKQGDPPIWDKPNSIGRGAKPLAPASGALLRDANEAMSRALAADGGADDEPPPNDDIPFASSAFAHDVNPIASVLR